MADANARYYGAAADYNKPGGSGIFRRILLLAGGLILLIILISVAFAVINSISSGPRRELEQLAAREQSLIAFTTTYQASITDSALTKINSETTTLVTSDWVSLMGDLGLEELSEEAIALEADTNATKLETARQAGRFNDEYQTTLQTKIAAQLQLALSAQQKTSNPQLSATLERTISNLQALQEQL
ncbi:MAG TPA: hypothetical protein VLA77_00505 [Candidatus Saccharimonadales bacterium]|nr:hypothetical protein [Candidatus Saccharimonadales bacterium]